MMGQRRRLSREGGKLMNKVILKGRLTRDPEVRRTEGEESFGIARFTLACDDRERQKDEKGNYPTNFIPCVCMGKLADIAERNLCKGKEVLISGKLQSGSYVNREGKKVYALDCFVKEIEYCGRKADSPMPYDDFFMNFPDGFEGTPFE